VRQKIVLMWISVFVVTIGSLIAWQMEENKPIFAASFDRAKWDRNARSEDGEIDANGVLQTRMALDLVAKKTLIGKSRSQIKQLLNEPTVFADESPVSLKTQMRYSLRTVYEFIDPVRADELIIQLDDRGKAISAKVVFRDLKS
jgi:hypothetical protein